VALPWAFGWPPVTSAISEQLIQEFLRTNAHEFSQCPAKRLIPERLTRYFFRYPVDRNTDGTNRRLAKALVNDLLQQSCHGERLPDAGLPSLWKAEQPDADDHRIAARWGCAALLCNPTREIPEDLLRGWAQNAWSSILTMGTCRKPKKRASSLAKMAC